MAKVREQVKKEPIKPDPLHGALSAGAEAFRGKKQVQVDEARATVERAKKDLEPIVAEARKTQAALRELREKYRPVLEELGALDAPTLYASVGMPMATRLQRALERAFGSTSGMAESQIERNIADIEHLTPESLKAFHASKIRKELGYVLHADRSARENLEQLACVVQEAQQRARPDDPIQLLTLDGTEPRQTHYRTDFDPLES